MEVSLRSGTPPDAESCGTVCYHAFKDIAEQHGFNPDFPSPGDAIGLMTWLFSRDDVYSVVAERDGRVVGSNFLWEQSLVAGIGPVTVDPCAQDHALGRRLMEHVLERAEKQWFAGVRLVHSAFHSRALSLYTKLGFAVREPLACLQGQPPRIEIPGHRVHPASIADLAACNHVCHSIHGYDRAEELHEAIQRDSALVVEHDGRITGYATAIGYFGHAVAESNEDLKALISAAAEITGPGFLLPSRNGELLQWCLRHGLRITQPLTLMSLGLYNEPAGPFLPSMLY